MFACPDELSRLALDRSGAETPSPDPLPLTTLSRKW